MIGSSGYQSPSNVKSGALWDNTSPRRFEYQSVQGVNEHRFKLINLPEIYSKNKKEPCFDYDKTLSRQDLVQPSDYDRTYPVKYDLV